MPDLCCLSESQIYLADVHDVLASIQGEYCYSLNSEDVHDPELPLLRSRSTGGTLCLWKKWLDPFVSVATLSSPSFLPIILKIPNHPISIHITLYLPTHGRDDDFIDALAELEICIEELTNTYPDALLFIRGDGNVNANNIRRVNLLHHFLEKFMLIRVNIPHATYHHFVGHGSYDSNIDIILHSSIAPRKEVVTDILCKLDYPEILSHHDPILSEFALPLQLSEPNLDNLITAPRVDIKREKIIWTEDGISAYHSLVAPQLEKLRERWLDPTSKTSMSVLLDATNKLLDKAAKLTNKTHVIGVKHIVSSARTPRAIIRAQKLLNKLARTKPKHSPEIKSAKANYRRVVRRARIQADVERFAKFDKIMDENPRSAFAFIRSCRKSAPVTLSKLKVGEKVYSGKLVPDGFYDSMSSIKSCKIDDLKMNPVVAEELDNYQHIMKLCSDKFTLPPVSMVQSSGILKRIKKHVRDIYNITAVHYSNAGSEGLLHYNHLLNGIIADVNNASLDELNSALGLILWKWHGKDKSSDRSYRTISTCPFLAKSLDLYLRDLYQEQWDKLQAETQYQGEGSNHELAALLVSEVVQFSLNYSNQPVFVLALDAQSAFDRCLRQILCAELYKAGINGTALTFIDTRLANRKTVYEWDGIAMGPAVDDTGFEQGGINSSDFYKLYNNEQLVTAQSSGLGVPIGSGVVSAVGQADDVLLMAASIHDLNLLGTLTELYCHKYRVNLVPSKTKLLVYSKPSHKHEVQWKNIVKTPTQPQLNST